MIASALRAEIERCSSAMRARNPFVLGAIREHRRARAPGPPASLTLLVALLDCGAREATAAHLAHQAFFQHLAAENGLTWMHMLQERCGIPRETLVFLGTSRDECRDRLEEALDALDQVVADPTHLPFLREELCTMVEHFNRLCWEVSDVGSLGEVNVSAA